MWDSILDTGYLVHIAMIGYVLGFLFRDQVILRVLILGGTLFYLAYYYLHPEQPLWGAIFASSMIFAANFIGLIALLYSRLPIGISAQHWPIFEALSGLEPGEFRRLMKLGVMRRAEVETLLTKEGEPLEHVYFVVSGAPKGLKDGVAFNLPGGEFVGEISFMIDGPATATVTLPEGGVYYEWRKEALRKAMDRAPGLSHAFEALIGRDLARKMATSRRAAVAA